MIREHFPDCEEIPDGLKEKLNKLCEQSDLHPRSKLCRYWGDIAAHLGLVDTIDGTMFRDDVLRTEERHDMLVGEDDRELAPTDYIYFLVSQCKRIYLTEFDRQQRGQNSFTVGMPGFGCRYCADIPGLMVHANDSSSGRFFAKKCKSKSIL